jgi:hypothetical protein
MTQIVLDPDLADELARRAERLGTTVQREASRILRERLEAESEARAEKKLEEAGVDPRFVHDHGFLVFTGELPPEEIPDQRTLQDERIDRIVKDAVTKGASPPNPGASRV